jgi:hypothetical protein
MVPLQSQCFLSLLRRHSSRDCGDAAQGHAREGVLRRVVRLRPERQQAVLRRVTQPDLIGARAAPRR